MNPRQGRDAMNPRQGRDAMKGKRFARIVFTDLPVKVICLTAAVVLFLFHRVNTLSERFFSVPLQVSTPPGLAIASSYPKSVRITLRGAEESIFPILEEDVEATASLDGHKSPGVFREQVRVARRGSAQNIEPLEIKVEPQEITFTVEPLIERRVEVVADIRGSPEYGYELAASTLLPQTIVIRGARSRVQGVSALSTEEMDLTGRSGSFSARLKIVPPNALVKIAGEPTVEYRATIQEAMGARTFSAVEVAALALSPHLAFASLPAPGSVRVTGAQLLLDSVRPEQVRLILDCAVVKRPGRYVLHPRPDVPAHLTVVEWAPREVTEEFVPMESAPEARNTER